MHIVIDCREWNAHNGAGISHYIEGIVKALLKQKTQHHFSLFFFEEMFLPASQIFAKDARTNYFFEKKSIPFWSSHILFAQKVMALKPVLFFFAIPPEKIHVVYPGIDPQVVSPESFSQQKKKNSFFPFLGTLEPRRNVGLILKAFDLFLEAHPSEQKNLSLILAGKRGWKYASLLQEIERINKKYAPAQHSVILEKGYVTTQEKGELLREATLFLFPSLYEGFGMPVLEALSVGIPVI